MTHFNATAKAKKKSTIDFEGGKFIPYLLHTLELRVWVSAAEEF